MIPQLNLLKNKIGLKMVIAIYEHQYDYHMEYHPVKDGLIQSARNFSLMTMTEIMRNLKLIKQRKVKEQVMILNKNIPQNLVYCDIENKCIHFITKARSQDILFNTESMLDSAVYTIPQMLYVYRNKALSVYAFKKWDGDKTKLYNIGLPNIDDDCDVCMGNVERETLTYVSDIIAQTETSFWNSFFGHWRYGTTEINETFREMWKTNRFVCSKHNFICTYGNLRK